MTHRRHLRAANPVALAISNAGKLSDQERALRLQPLQFAFGRMREGIAKTDDWVVLASACNVAMAIELQGVVKGLREHLHSTELTLQAINQRAQDDRGPYPYALHVDEIDKLRTFLDLYAFQIGQLSRGELREATRYAVAEVSSSGGQVVLQAPARAPMHQEALQL